jgi:glycine cleavage system H protein
MNIFYTKDHEWIGIEGGEGTAGITAYAAGQLGDITFVELPKTGKVAAKGDVLCTIESVKAASDIFAPLSGTVKTVNAALEENPGLINQDPEKEGWIAKMELRDLQEKDTLMDRQAYEAYIKGLI